MNYNNLYFQHLINFIYFKEQNKINFNFISDYKSDILLKCDQNFNNEKIYQIGILIIEGKIYRIL